MIRPLYMITDGGARRIQNTLVADIKDGLEGGAGAVGFILIREVGDRLKEIPPASDREIIRIANELRSAVRDTDAKLIMHRRVDLAIAVEADGIHLSANTIKPSAVRAAFGNRFILGYSAHSSKEAQTAVQEGVDYLLLSPIFPTLSKQGDNRLPLGVKGLKEIVSEVPLPIFALGGITKENVKECRNAGAAGIAGISAFFEKSANPKIAAASIAEAWGNCASPSNS